MFLNQLRLNLQFFSQDDTGGSNPSDDEKGNDTQDGQDDSKGEEKEEKDERTFTQKELDDIVQQRLRRAEKEKQDAIDEAKKLAKMNADEKREYELEKLKQENEELKAVQIRFELGKEATKMLATSGITATDEILDFVVREDAETTSEAVIAFTELITDTADALVKEKLKGNGPRKQTGVTGITKQDILNIKDSAERIRAIQENQHLFK